ncbi:potassium channel family protein [Streptomyces sp. NPDC002520]
MDDDNRMRRWERRTDLPLTFAWLVYLGAYAVHVLAHGLSGAAHDLLLSLTSTAWAFFAVDYVVRWRLSGTRLPLFVRRHWLDSVVVILPLLRPVRIVRTYETVERRHGRSRLPLQIRVMLYAGLGSVLVGFAGALEVYQAEHDAPYASIRTFGDSAWWVCSTLSTVGYGDVVPVTVRGRLIAVVMMICGLALLGAVTGSFTSWLMQRFARGGDGGDGQGPPGR